MPQMRHGFAAQPKTAVAPTLSGVDPFASNLITAFSPYQSYYARRVAAKNHVRRSASSIHASIKLAVATSFWRSQTA